LEGVSIICATSRPDLIDPALLRSGRIDRLVECQLPNAVERLDILKFLSKSLVFDSSASANFKELASKMNGFTGADIKSILTTANMKCIEEELTKSNGKPIEQVEIKQVHLQASLANTRPSLTKQDIEKYRVLYDKFKNKKSVTVETPQRVSLA
jgi:peroxin-1